MQISAFVSLNNSKTCNTILKNYNQSSGELLFYPINLRCPFPVAT